MWPTVSGACCRWEIDEHGSIFKQPCVKNPGCTGERFPSVWMTEVHSTAAAPPVPVWQNNHFEKEPHLFAGAGITYQTTTCTGTISRPPLS